MTIKTITVCIVVSFFFSCNKKNSSSTPPITNTTTVTVTPTPTNIPLTNNSSNYSSMPNSNQGKFEVYHSNSVWFCDGIIKDASNNFQNIGTVTVNGHGCVFNSLAGGGYRLYAAQWSTVTPNYWWGTSSISATGTSTSGITAFTVTTKTIPNLFGLWVDTTAQSKSAGFTIKHTSISTDSIYYMLSGGNSFSYHLYKKVAGPSNQIFFTASEIANLTNAPISGKVDVNIVGRNFTQVTLSSKQFIFSTHAYISAPVKLNP